LESRAYLSSDLLVNSFANGKKREREGEKREMGRGERARESDREDPENFEEGYLMWN
jgi:hypothetical protein